MYVPLWIVAPIALAGPRPPALELGDGRPLSYVGELWVDPAQPTFRGEIDIEVDLEGRRKLLWLNALELDVTDASMRAGDRDVAVTLLDGDEQTIGLSWAGALDGVVTVHLEWEGKVQDDASFGLFHQSEGGADYLFTQFESVDARRVFPCFDQPGFKTPWTITLHVPATVGAWSNAPAESDTVDGDERTVRFARSEPLPTYLVALAVGPFEVVDVGTFGRNPTPIRILVPPGRGPDAAYAVETIPRIFEYEEAWFDRPYPYAKLDLVAVPMTIGYGAMEHAGLITVAQGIVLARSADEDTLERRQYWAIVFGHELAHQWFGNLVTMAWWDDLWLNESFASWLESVVTKALWPEWDPEAERVGVRALALSADSLPSVQRVREPIVELGDIEQSYGAITYQKGQTVIGAIEAWIGPEAFQRGIRRYLSDHEWGNATADDLAAAIATETPLDVRSVIEGYVDQPGAPMVTFDIVCDDAPRLDLTQQRYVVTGRPGRQRWDIPLCVRTDAGRFCGRLDGRTGTLPLPSCPAWVVPNDGAYGYYRSRMSAPDFEAMLGADLSLAEQIGALGDGSALVAIGDLEPALLLDRLPAIVALDKDAVTREAVGIVQSLDAYTVSDDLRPAYQRFVLDTFGPKARELGLATVEGEPGTTTNLRPALIGLVGSVGQDPEVTSAAVTRVTAWLDTGERIDPDVLSVLLSLAGRFGSPELAARLRDRALAEEDRELRAMLFAAVSEVRDPDALRGMLDLSLRDDTDLRDMGSLVTGPFSHPDQRAVAWDWYVANLDAIEAKVPVPFRFYLTFPAGAWCDAGHRAEVERVLGPHAKHWLGGKRALQNGLDAIDACEASVARQAPGVRAFLEGRP